MGAASALCTWVTDADSPSHFLRLITRQGSNIDTGEDVAIKLEHVSIDPSLLEGESDTYRSLF